MSLPPPLPPSLQVLDQWEPVTEADVQTPLEVYQELLGGCGGSGGREGGMCPLRGLPLGATSLWLPPCSHLPGLPCRDLP